LIELLASPHPLDFDWRFDAPTVAKLCDLVQARSVLALGAPSVARRIEAIGGRILLVDRQPVQKVRNHLVADIPTLNVPEGGFDIAITDAPWYPRDLVAWVSVAARAVRPGGQVLVSLWPPEARPTATGDLSCVMAELRDWAKVTELPIELTYEVPFFELVAMSISENRPLARSPRHGRLVRLEVHRQPPPPCSARPALWHRFFLDGYQLAVRLGVPNTAQSLIVPPVNGRVM
jgi:SAM-dependent methyltransferase